MKTQQLACPCIRASVVIPRPGANSESSLRGFSLVRDDGDGSSLYVYR